jgi:hypothetical protein
VWAFLALKNDTGNDNQRCPSLGEATMLGKILQIIETSLVQWESCKLADRHENVEAKDTGKGVKNISAFFGKKFRHLPFHRLDDVEDDVDNNSTLASTCHLPLLRDLPFDPFTLCKVVCYLERLTESDEKISGSNILTRVALRLLASRNGRLIGVCPIQDLLFITEAAARCSISSSRETVSHFARRLAYHLNHSGRDN